MYSDYDFESFRQNLSNKNKKNMHFLFFQKNPKISSLKLSILNNNTPNIRLNPYRNIYCQKPSCIYDYNDLLQLYHSSKIKINPNFICENCQTIINLSSFFCDITLKELIDKIWIKYNKPNQIICSSVKIFRDGHCKPIISEYIQLMEKNIVDNFVHKKKKENNYENKHELENQLFKVPGFYQNNEAPLKFTLSYGIFPKLTDFTQIEYDKLEENLSDSEVSTNIHLLERYSNIIFLRDFMNLKAEANFPFSVMAILLMYFQDLQKNDFDEYNYKKCNRGLFLSYKLKKYDSFYKNIESEIFFGMKNFYVQQPQALYSNFDMLFIVIFYEDRYILYVYILKKHFLMIVDFLDRDL